MTMTQWFEKDPKQRLLNDIFRKAPFEKVTMWVWEHLELDHPSWWEKPILKVNMWLADFDHLYVNRKFLIGERGVRRRG